MPGPPCRPSAKLASHKLHHARPLIAEGKETKAGASALLGIDAVTLRRVLRGGNEACQMKSIFLWWMMIATFAMFWRKCSGHMDAGSVVQ